MIGFLFIARLGSTRLPRKHLIKVNNQPFIIWLLNRFYHTFSKDISQETVKLIVTTSTKPDNREFENIVDKNLATVFYGEDDNIPQRLLQCAEEFDIKYIIPIDGDDILCSTISARLIMKKLIDGAEYVNTEGLPLGMNIMGFTRNFLKNALENNKRRILETGWGKIFDEVKLQTLKLASADIENVIRLTLDYELDQKLFKTILENLDDEIFKISDNELISLILKNKWYEINSELNDIYWGNFNKQKYNE